MLDSVVHEVELTAEAVDDLRILRRRERRAIFKAIDEQLQHEPAQETRNRKRLRPNRLAEWELRIERYRVFYDVDSAAGRVKVIAIGVKKGNRLYIQNQEYEL